MKPLNKLLILLASICYAFAGYCSVTNEYSQAVNLTFCTQYSSNSCCTKASDDDLKNNMLNKVAFFFGAGGCFENLKKLFCGWNCDPNMNSYTSLASGTTANNLSVYIDPNFYNGLFESCKKICFKVGGEVEVEQRWSNGASFVQYFSSDVDSTYVPNKSDRPRIIYIPKSSAQSPTGNSFNTTVASPTDSDLIGCTPDTSAGSEVFSSVFMFVILIVLVKFM